MAPPRLCEDVLRKILAFLLQAEAEDEDGHCCCVVLNFMLVSRSWLEVGRQRLYNEPDIRESSDSVFLFQTSILHLNNDLGTYVRNFQARRTGIGHLMLARMVFLMPNLQALDVDSMEFTAHYPDAACPPRLSRLAVHASMDAASSLALRRKGSRYLDMNRTKMDWILYTRECHLSGLRIYASSAIRASSQPKNLNTLILERCEWDNSTCAEVIPQISDSVKELLFLDFGLTSSEWPSRTEPLTWLQSSQRPSREINPALIKSMLPSFYGLSRHVTRLDIQYAANCIFGAGPNLSLLSSDIKMLGIDYQGSTSIHLYMHYYPHNARNFYVKLNELDYQLLSFIEDLNNPEYLDKLETHPYIWIRTPWGSPSGLPASAVERWETAREVAAVTLAQRGLDVNDQPFELVERVGPLGSGLIEYSSFWCMSFSPPTDSVVQLQGEAPGVGGAGDQDGDAVA